MIIKELKKIVFSKIIIALLISLCIVNVLYETRAEIETKEQIAAQDKLQKNKIDNYGKYLIKIKEDGTNMQSIVLFSKNNKFQLSNAKRTVKAYEAVKNVKPVYGNYRVIEKITEFGLTDIILFVMVVQIALILVSQEIKKGMLDLLKSCRNGRLNLIVNKMVALSITSAIAIIIVYGIKFVQLYIKYGLSGMNVPIQSVRGFYEFALPMQIWQYMIIYFMVKWIAVCIIGIVVIGIISLVKNETVTYGIILISTAVSLLITNSIEWNMSTAVFKMLSPVTLLNTKSFMAKYININILQHPFELFKWTLIIMAVYLSASIVFTMYSFTTKRVIKFPHLRIAKGQKNIGIKSKGILSYEKKKIFAVNKVAFFVIILVVIQGYFLSNDNTKMDYHDKCYANYISKVYGVPDKKSQEYLDTEQKRYDEIQAGYDELTEKYINGEVDNQVYVMASQEYNAQMMPYDDFQKVQEKNDYLKELKEKQNIEGWFTNDLVFGYIFGDVTIYDKDISFLILFIIAVFCVVPIFTYDRQKEMQKLLDTTYYGRSKLIRNKYLNAILISVVLWCIETIPWLVILLKAYKPNGFAAPARSLSQLQHFPLHISILAALILIYLCKCMGIILLGLLVVGISDFFPDYIKNVVISMGIIVMPVVLYMLGVEFMNKIMFIPVVNMSDYFTKATVVEWINLAIIIVAVFIMNFKNLKNYTKRKIL